MAYTTSNSGSDSKVKTCSKECLKSFKAFQKQYEAFIKSHLQIIDYQVGLESLEARIVVHQKNEDVYEEDIALLKLDVQLRNISIKELKNQLERSQLDANNKTGLGYGNHVNGCEANDSKSVSDEDDSLVNDRFKKSNGNHAVPPPYTGNYMSPRADLSFAGLDYLVYKCKATESISNESYVETNESDSDNDSTISPMSDQPKHTPIKINFVKPVECVECGENEKQAEKPTSFTQNPKVDRKDWNKLKVQKLGLDFGFTKKACFVCGSLSHLIRDCTFHEDKMGKKSVIKNNVGQAAILTKCRQVLVNAAKQSSHKAAASVSTARRVNTAAPRPNVNSARPKTTQDLVIIKLILRVKRLERELKAITPPIKIQKNNRFFWVDESVFPTVVDWRTNAPKDGMLAAGTYSVKAVRALDMHRTPIQKQPKMLFCLVGLSRRYYLEDEVYPTFLHDNDRDMDLFSLIRAPNPTKVKVESRLRAPHEVPLLTLTVNRVIEMDDPTTASDSSEVPPSGDVPAAAAPEPSRVELLRQILLRPQRAAKEAMMGPTRMLPPSHCEEIMLILGPSEALMGERASLPYSWAWLLLLLCLKMHLQASVTQIPCVLLILWLALRLMFSLGVVAAEDPESENAFSPTEVGSPGGVYRPEWSVTNGSLLDTPEACQDLVDHVAPPGYFSELRHMRNEDFLGQYNVARRDKRIEARELEIKNLEALLETKADMKRAAEDKSAGLIKELEDMRARFSDLQVSHGHLSQHVASLKEQVSGEEKLKAAFEEFKRYEDERVERRYAELDARLDALSINFDEELYPHMLTAITGRKWVIGHGLRLAMMKCVESLEMRQAFADVVSAGVAKGMSEGLKHRVEHGQAQLTVESIEAYDPEAEAKFVAALQSLKDLKYPLLDQLEGLKDAPMDVIMAALYLESDTGGMPYDIYATSAPAPLSSPSSCTWRSDGVPVSVPTVVPQGLALLLVDAATQTDLEDT
nr:transposase (putative), gypsy type [Tanacetum cinerariifolium]